MGFRVFGGALIEEAAIKEAEGLNSGGLMTCILLKPSNLKDLNVGASIIAYTILGGGGGGGPYYTYSIQGPKTLF